MIFCSLPTRLSIPYYKIYEVSLAGNVHRSCIKLVTEISKIAIKNYFPCAIMAVQIFLHAHNSLSLNESFYMWHLQSTILIVAYEGLSLYFIFTGIPDEVMKNRVYLLDNFFS